MSEEVLVIFGGGNDGDGIVGGKNSGDGIVGDKNYGRRPEDKYLNDWMY